MKTEGLPVTAVVERVNRISFASPLVVKLVDNFGARVNLGIKKKKEREKIGKVWIDRWIDRYQPTSKSCTLRVYKHGMLDRKTSTKIRRRRE